MRKLYLLLLLAATSAAEVTEVRIPTGAGGVGFLPLLVMEKYQLIEKHANVHVRWIKLGGPSVMNDALLSGSADFSTPQISSARVIEEMHRPAASTLNRWQIGRAHV